MHVDHNCRHKRRDYASRYHHFVNDSFNDSHITHNHYLAYNYHVTHNH